jgi:hypothetical protein
VKVIHGRKVTKQLMVLIYQSKAKSNCPVRHTQYKLSEVHCTEKELGYFEKEAGVF